MSQAIVWYTVPVGVVVDLEAKTVDQVIVIDESIELDDAEGVTDRAYSKGLGKKKSKKAIKVAEGDGGWPGSARRGTGPRPRRHKWQ